MPQKELKEKMKDWEKEFDRQFCYRESKKGKMVLVGIVHFAENYKSFIRQLLAQRDKMWQKRIKAIEELNKLSKKIENL